MDPMGDGLGSARELSRRVGEFRRSGKVLERPCPIRFFGVLREARAETKHLIVYQVGNSCALRATRFLLA